MSNRLWELEGRFERLRLDIQAMQQQIKTALQQIQSAQQIPVSSGNSGSGGIFEYPGTAAIGAGSAITGASVYSLVGGTSTLVTATAKIYNIYQAGTTAGKSVTVGLNPDGSYIVIAQSC